MYKVQTGNEHRPGGAASPCLERKSTPVPQDSALFTHVRLDKKPWGMSLRKGAMLSITDSRFPTEVLVLVDISRSALSRKPGHAMRQRGMGGRGRGRMTPGGSSAV